MSYIKNKDWKFTQEDYENFVIFSRNAYENPSIPQSLEDLIERATNEDGSYKKIMIQVARILRKGSKKRRADYCLKNESN
jgi:hypothetical protein